MSAAIPKALFRADASPSIGMGHIQRCLTLADELRRQGSSISFLSGVSPGLKDFLQSIHWVDWHWVEDASIDHLPNFAEDFKFIIVDHYELDSAWEVQAQSIAHCLLAIDDTASRPHAADVLLDQNFFPDASMRYSRWIRPTTQQLLGPRYALLRPEFAIKRAHYTPAPVVQKVLIQAGGSDPTGLTELALEALALVGGVRQIRAIVGAANPRASEIVARYAETDRVEVIRHTEAVVDHMLWADLCIGATGSSTWERACLGLPSVVVSVAENQLAIGQSAHAAGLTFWAGPASAVSVKQLAHAIENVINSPSSRMEQWRIGRSLVDGLGARRVATYLNEFALG